MPIKHELERAKLWIDIDDVEQSALDQINLCMTHPKLYEYLAIMPDVHMGIGCTIGSIIPMEDVIIPACVGVDIGCGMCSVKTNLHLEDIKPMFEELHRGIHLRIPVGFNHRKTREQLDDVKEYLGAEHMFRGMIEEYQEKYPGKEIAPQLGTLGGGNHFIELQLDQKGNVWIMIHSGSRNIGNLIASTHIKKAKELTNPDENIPKDMEYLYTASDEGSNYIYEMIFGVEFAKNNRYLMMMCVMEEIEARCYQMHAGYYGRVQKGQP